MPITEFFFSVEFSGYETPVQLVGEVVASVLGCAGTTRNSLPTLADALQRSVAPGGNSGQRCDVRCTAHDGHIDVLVLSGGTRIWQSSEPIP